MSEDFPDLDQPLLDPVAPVDPTEPIPVVPGRVPNPGDYPNLPTYLQAIRPDVTTEGDAERQGLPPGEIDGTEVSLGGIGKIRSERIQTRLPSLGRRRQALVEGTYPDRGAAPVTKRERFAFGRSARRREKLIADAYEIERGKAVYDQAGYAGAEPTHDENTVNSDVGTPAQAERLAQGGYSRMHRRGEEKTGRKVQRLQRSVDRRRAELTEPFAAQVQAEEQRVRDGIAEYEASVIHPEALHRRDDMTAGERRADARRRAVERMPEDRREYDPFHTAVDARKAERQSQMEAAASAAAAAQLEREATIDPDDEDGVQDLDFA